MKYIYLFEQFEEGYKFELLDLFTISPSEVKELYFEELDKDVIDLDNVRTFLDSKILNIDITGNLGQTPLHHAAWINNVELTLLLIDNGANINAKTNSDTTPLHIAAFRNSIDVAKILIEKGAKINSKDRNRDTPLCLVKTEIMRDLIKQNGGRLR